MIVGDLAILKNQQKGSFTLYGGYIVEIVGQAVILAGTVGLWVWPLDNLEPFTEEYVTLIGNEILPPPKNVRDELVS